VGLFLIRAKQTPETWRRLVDNPEDRRKASTEGQGVYAGKFHGYWYAFGDYDIYALIEAPDNIAATTLLVKLAGSGAFSDVSTVPLLTVDEMLEALRRAKTVDYTPPGASATLT
jgi:uncharacterized protein with GYD domain